MPVILAITRYNARNVTVTTAEIKGIAKKKFFKKPSTERVKEISNFVDV